MQWATPQGCTMAGLTIRETTDGCEDPFTDRFRWLKLRECVFNTRTDEEPWWLSSKFLNCVAWFVLISDSIVSLRISSYLLPVAERLKLIFQPSPGGFKDIHFPGSMEWQLNLTKQFFFNPLIVGSSSIIFSDHDDLWYLHPRVGGTLFNPLSGQISSWLHVVTETWNGNWIWITISKMAQLFSLVKYDDLLRYRGNSMGQWDDGYPLVISYIVNPIWGFLKS